MKCTKKLRLKIYKPYIYERITYYTNYYISLFVCLFVSMDDLIKGLVNILVKIQLSNISTFWYVVDDRILSNSTIFILRIHLIPSSKRITTRVTGLTVVTPKYSEKLTLSQSQRNGGQITPTKRAWSYLIKSYGYSPWQGSEMTSNPFLKPA